MHPQLVVRTDGAGPREAVNSPDAARTLAPLLAPVGDFRCDSLRSHDNTSMGTEEDRGCPNSKRAMGVEDDCEPLRKEENSPSRIRTYNPPVNPDASGLCR